MQRVLVHPVAVVSDERQDAAETPCLKDRAGFPGAHQLQDLDALLGQVLGGPGGELRNDQPVADGPYGPFHGHDAPGAFR